MSKTPTSDGSSDDVRSAKPLRHVQTAEFLEPMPLELGGALPHVTVAYETYGTLNAAGDNAVLVCHALSGDSHVARHDPSDEPGWWELMVGPLKGIDTDRYFVICPNILGGCRGTTGPNTINPATGRRYGSDFPPITIGDIVQVHQRLIDRLGIDTLYAVIGGSVGGMQAVVVATRLAERVKHCITLATAPRLTSQALAFDVVARNAILHDPHYESGQYYDRPHAPTRGLALARMLGHITYLSREAMTAKFDPTRLRPREVATDFEKRFSVGSYLAYQGDKFVERFDANSYVTLSLAMDYFDLGETPEQLARSLSPATCRWLVVSFSSDWLFPPFQSRQMVDALLSRQKPTSYCEVTTSSGHDAFLLDDSRDVYGPLVSGFLAPSGAAGDLVDSGDTGSLPEDARESEADHDAAGWGSSAEAAAATGKLERPGRNRFDQQTILQMIPPAASVLDLGCGDGSLLSAVRARRQAISPSPGRPPALLVGVEIDSRLIVQCVQRGLDVVDADLNQPLTMFPRGQFDVVVLSQTLQAINDTQGVLREMLRVGNKAIVSFPNFAYRKLRDMLNIQGRSPKTPGAYGYEWHNTPNRRFASILDVRELVQRSGFVVLEEVCFDSETGRVIDDDPNLNADIAVMVIGHASA